MDSFKQMYKVEKNPIQVSYEKQLGLREDKIYEDITYKRCVDILNYFSNLFENVEIQMPKMRKKSPKSIKEKSKNKEIERLTKLYMVEGISKEDEKELYSLLESRVYERKDIDAKSILEQVNKLFNEQMEKINVEEFIDIAINPKLSKSTKRSILRVLIGKLQKSNLENKKEKIKYIDDLYGTEASKRLSDPEKDIISYKSIEEILADDNKKKLLHEEVNYLKSDDLMGMKIVISNVPSDIKTDNDFLKKIINLRCNQIDKNKKNMYDNMAMQEIAREFTEKITNDEEFLNELGVEIIPYSVKHKNKANGYEAYHFKIRSKDNPEYTLEVQVKSEYVEVLAKGNGKAGHANRPGKERILPNIDNPKDFLDKIHFMVPEYTIFTKGEKGYRPKKCSKTENVISYYESILNPEDEEYDKVLEILNGEDIVKDI